MSTIPTLASKHAKPWYYGLPTNLQYGKKLLNKLGAIPWIMILPDEVHAMEAHDSAPRRTPIAVKVIPFQPTTSADSQAMIRV